MSQFDLFVVGGCLQDIVIQTSHGKVMQTPNDPLASAYLMYELGAKIPLDDARIMLGGGGLNVAATSAKFGLRVSLAACVGNDQIGNQILQHATDLGITTDRVQRSQDRHTGFSVILIKNPEGEHVAFPYRGANEELTSDAVGQIDAPWIYVSGLQGPHWHEVMQSVFSSRDTHSAQIACNPGTTQLVLPFSDLKDFISLCNVLIVNKDEAHEILLRDPAFSAKESGISTLSPFEMLGRIRAYGASIVVITDGADGAYAIDESHSYFAPSVSVHAVDSTGAGDSFGGAFVSALSVGKSVQQALAYAMINSASVVQQIGAQNGILSRSDIEARLAQVQITIR